MIDDLQTWERCSVPHRLAFARALADALDLEPLDHLVGAAGLAAVRDPATGLEWIAVPGGRFTMGLRGDELRPLLRMVSPPCRPVEEYRRLLMVSQPAREVVVRPFLCARTPVPVSRAGPGAWGWVLQDGGHELDPRQDWPAEVGAAAAVAVARDHGARLLSEAEWEYVARAGGRGSWLTGEPEYGRVEAWIDALVEAPAARHLRAEACTAFGVWGLQVLGWVADGWHDDYEGAPADAAPWDPNAGPGVLRGGTAAFWPWQSDERLWCHAAVRTRASANARAVVHLARAMPELQPVEAPSASAPAAAPSSLRAGPVDLPPEPTQVEGCVRVEVQVELDGDGWSTYLLDQANVCLVAWVPLPGRELEPPPVEIGARGSLVRVAVAIRDDRTFEAIGFGPERADEDDVGEHEIFRRLLDPHPRPEGAIPPVGHVQIRWVEARVELVDPEVTVRGRVGPVVRERRVVAQEEACALCRGTGRRGARECVTCDGRGVRVRRRIAVDS